MFVEAFERHFLLTERNPCVASTLTTAPVLVISRLSKVVKIMSISTLPPLDIGSAYFRNWHCPAIRARPLNLCIHNNPCMSQQCLPRAHCTYCINPICPFL